MWGGEWNDPDVRESGRFHTFLQGVESLPTDAQRKPPIDICCSWTVGSYLASMKWECASNRSTFRVGVGVVCSVVVVVMMMMICWRASMDLCREYRTFADAPKGYASGAIPRQPREGGNDGGCGRHSRYQSETKFSIGWLPSCKSNSTSKVANCQHFALRKSQLLTLKFMWTLP